MTRNALWIVLPALLLALLAGVTLAADDKNSHTGTFVSAKSDREFVMEDKGQQHTHMLAADAKLLDANGKECKLADFRAGQKIRVWTKEGDKATAIKVQALKDTDR